MNEHSRSHLIMYVHMHWGYNHPYAARTWTLDDWRGYAGGLEALGYNSIMIWPIFDTMPIPLTPSDHAHLDKIRQVIDMLHSELGMSVFITMGPNTIGNEKAAEYSFETRPYFETELRLNPGDPAQLDQLIESRRMVFEYLGKADAFSIIDGDPGGYIGSTNEDFAELLLRHLELIKEFNPAAYIYYWMWTGWEAYNKMWEHAEKYGGSPEINITADDFEIVLRKLLEHPNENWGILANRPVHMEVIDKLGIEDRAIFNPYNLLEIEPTFPLTNHHPKAIFYELNNHDFNKTRLGIMANAQTHVVQLPNTYYFAHFAKGGTMENADLASFAECLIPGLGELIADAWKTMRTDESAEMRCLAKKLSGHVSENLHTGKYAGLMLGGAKRFLMDLQIQLEFRADVVDFIQAVENESDQLDKLSSLISSWRTWQERTGFADAYVDTQNLHSALLKLGNKEINSVIADFDDWRDPTIRNGIVYRLLSVLENYANGPEQNIPSH